MAGSQGKFAGQVVLITGASSGIGAAVAREFAREGAHTVLMARRTELTEALARELTGDGRRSLALTGDVNRDGDLEHAVEVARSEFGRLDVAVANAGFSVRGRLIDITLDDYRRQLETNVFGVLRTIYAALPELRKTRGRIVLLSSWMGVVPTPGGTAYSMSKFALTGLALGLSHELAPYGVSVTNIMPGFVASEIYQVDNRGVRHDAPAQRIPPKWAILPTDVAARQIVSATYRRQRVRVLTLYAKIAVFMQRHFPRLLHFAIARALEKAGYAETKQAGTETRSVSNPGA
jgi:NAD(P)-dependent dehydrogenase (short-subunit alcohol dehydrogenase family)